MESDPKLEDLLRHTRWIEELAQRLVRDPAAAQDLAQSVWVVALRSGDRPRANLRGWLGAVLRNLARQPTRPDRRAALRVNARGRAPGSIGRVDLTKNSGGAARGA